MDTLKDWAWLAGGLLTFITFVKGLMEYSKNNKIKRTEFLEKLIAEFNEPKTFLAKRILDDFWYADRGQTDLSDEQLIQNASEESIEKATLTELIQNLLRDHRVKPVANFADQRVRQSFDDLLDFFTKLDYYLTLKIIAKEELYYFRYYIERCCYKAKGAVMQYADRYGYPSLFRLFYVLEIEPNDKELYRKNLIYNSDKQESYYYDLRNNIPLLQ